MTESIAKAIDRKGLRVRKPSGHVPWPLVLIEGPEKSGKSWACAAFSASERVGQMYWLDLGEGAADEYGAIAGADYLIVDHDGSWLDIVSQVEAVRDEAARAAAAGEKPVVLVVDSMSNEWTSLSDWANQRAKKTESNRRKLAQNPDADVQVGMNLWNDATARHRRLMTLLLTFPGIVIVTARGKDVAAMDDNGKPSGEKTYKVEGHKTLAYDASVWVRLSRDVPPVVIGARSVKHGIRPGIDKPKPAPQFSLEWLVFDVLGCDPQVAEARDLKPVEGGEATDEERGVDPLKAAKDTVWAEALKRGLGDAVKLAAAYEAWATGDKLPEAGVEDLRQFAEYLRTDPALNEPQP
jgi:hypothetical protein